MNLRGVHRFLLFSFVLAGMVGGSQIVHAVELEFENRSIAQEIVESGIGGLLAQLSDPYEAPPVFTDYGDGFYSLSVTLRPEARERLLASLGSSDKADKAQTFFVLAAGQRLGSPVDPENSVHAALSKVNAAYNYWVWALNLGPQNLARTTTLRLNGPGRKFNQSRQFVYGADGIWVVWYNPGGGTGRPGVYTLQATIAGVGSVTARSIAVNP